MDFYIRHGYAHGLPQPVADADSHVHEPAGYLKGAVKFHFLPEPASLGRYVDLKGQLPYNGFRITDPQRICPGLKDLLYLANPLFTMPCTRGLLPFPVVPEKQLCHTAPQRCLCPLQPYPLMGGMDHLKPIKFQQPADLSHVLVQGGTAYIEDLPQLFHGYIIIQGQQLPGNILHPFRPGIRYAVKPLILHLFHQQAEGL